MSIISDKRAVGRDRDRTAENRQRFLRRIKPMIKDQLPDIIKGRSLKDIDQTGGNIKINRKTIREPFFHHGVGGNIDKVLPGNTEYIAGDLIDKPQSGSGGSTRKGSSGSEGQDEFEIELSREEFLEAFFEDLELPRMTETQLSKLKEVIRENAGFQTQGSPTKLSLVRSYKNSIARRRAIIGGIDEEIEKLEADLAKFIEQKYDLFDDVITGIKGMIAELLVRRENVPLFEDVDLRYKTSTIRILTKSHATNIMAMDNSGSMGEREKTIARKFFWLLYKFVKLTYDEIDLIFVSHTTRAKQMGEEEFFTTRDTGGTLVSSALDEIVDILNGVGSFDGVPRERLIGKTNIYIAQVSDGDNEDTDNGTCREILEDDILPHVRYYAYIQVDDYHGDMNANPSLTSILNMDRGLWKTYTQVSTENPVLQARRVFSEKDIFPVFAELFKKETA